MIFEYDENKSKSNQLKHNIDFEEAKLLWNDDNRIEIKASCEEEKRFLTIGKIHNKFYTIITTYRNNKIRIISARRSREKEIEIYES
ncbi:MAG: BrnT family toxin [Epsilonproteobacteria bacterium]|nr:BrnT family toxin [Campylobacterota bacterium]